jgi:protein-disulfide isomerase
MKRFLPFIIIIIVGLATVGGAIVFYRAKMQPLTAVTPAAKPAATAGTSAAPTTGTTVAATTGTTPAEVGGSPSTEPPALLAQPEENSSLHVRGPSNAPVTLEIYGDFQCPSCRVAAMLIKDLEADYGDKMREIFYEFPLAMHNHSVEAARAAEAAGIQGKFWEMHDQLYEHQDVWSKVSSVSFFFDTYAQSLGLDVARFRADCQSPDVQQMVISQGDAGAARGVQNTPTIFINGKLLRAGFTKEKIQEAIDAALAEKGKS